MIKLEIIHNNQMLKAIHKLRANAIYKGFTTLNVLKSFGPNDGDFDSDFLSDEHFYTFFILDNIEEAHDLVKKLKTESPNNSFFRFITPVVFKEDS